jgi:hypothetical protein
MQHLIIEPQKTNIIYVDDWPKPAIDYLRKHFAGSSEVIIISRNGEE